MMTKYLILPLFLMCSLSMMGSDEDRIEIPGSDEVTQGTLTRSGLRIDRFVTTVDGKQTKLFTLSNNGMEACITNYGARVVSLMVPDQTRNRISAVWWGVMPAASVEPVSPSTVCPIYCSRQVATTSRMVAVPVSATVCGTWYR